MPIMRNSGYYYLAGKGGDPVEVTPSQSRRGGDAGSSGSGPVCQELGDGGGLPPLSPVAQNLRLAGAYRRLLGMEVQAHTEGASTHRFPPCCHGLVDRLTVAAVEGGYEYLWVDGPVSREAAARILATEVNDG